MKHGWLTHSCSPSLTQLTLIKEWCVQREVVAAITLMLLPFYVSHAESEDHNGLPLLLFPDENQAMCFTSKST